MHAETNVLGVNNEDLTLFNKKIILDEAKI